MDVGFVVSVAGDESQSETAEGEEKSVHGRVVERKHTARTGCASGVGEVGMRPADAGEADSVPREGYCRPPLEVVSWASSTRKAPLPFWFMTSRQMVLGRSSLKV